VCLDGLISVLADLHSVDPGAVGLNDFGRRDGYLQRQVHRWASQWDHVRAPDDHCDGDVQRLYGLLVRWIPPQSGTSIVHGDYRIDNIIVDSNDPARVRAVVDWELSTLGDPLSDVASMCVYRGPALDLIIGESAAWTSSLLPSSEDIAQRYAAVSGRPLRSWSFYLASAYFNSRSSPLASPFGVAVAGWSPLAMVQEMPLHRFSRPEFIALRGDATNVDALWGRSAVT
jgi:aminoglycoside phosphotransferase (APT) family kinase protein